MTAMSSVGNLPASKRRRPALPSPFSALTRMMNRRNRRATLGWTLSSAFLTVYISAVFVGLYNTAALRREAAALFNVPSARVFSGPGYGMDVADPNVGVLFSAKLLLTLAVMAFLAGLLMTLARTRGDESDGPGELIRAAEVPILAPARSAAISATLTGVLLGLACALAAIAGGLDVLDSLVMGVGLFLVDLSGVGLGLVMGALAPTVRSARGWSLLVLLAFVSLRGVGDLTDGGTWLSWSNPLGLLLQLRLWAGINPVPLALLTIWGTALVTLGMWLQGKREYDAGIVTLGRGGRSRAHGPRSTVALALRTTRAARAWWFVGTFAFGLMLGALVTDMQESMEQMFADMPQLAGMADLMSSTTAFLGFVLLYGALIAAACAVVLAGGLVKEESLGTAGGLLSGPVGRTRWALARVAVVTWGTLTTLLAMALALLVTAVPMMQSAGSVDSAGARHLSVSIVLGVVAYWPAALVIGAVVVLVAGFAPRWANVGGWVTFAVSLFLAMFAELSELPQWVMDLSPLVHVPDLPTAVGESVFGETAAWMGPGVCLLVATVLVAVGLWGLRRRDLGA